MRARSKVRKGERGATLVEFAFVVALLALLGATAVKGMQDRALIRYDSTASEISPGGGTDGGTTGGATGGATGGDDGGTDGTAAPPPAAISSSCSGSSCQLSVTSAPAGSTITWTTQPDVGTDTGPRFSLTGLKKDDSYTVTATISPSGETVTVTCERGNGLPTCTAG